MKIIDLRGSMGALFRAYVIYLVFSSKITCSPFNIISAEGANSNLGANSPPAEGVGVTPGGFSVTVPEAFEMQN